MPKPYIWWDGADLEDFFAKVGTLGARNVIIEWHPEDSLLYVRPKEGGEVTTMGDGDGDDGYNYSHKCPPDCSGG